ncbi:hypothetical protein B0H14DRAFT_2604583 [Mycena olivaceomarginata]|nr:hypothetical protein B0H14DRAFT_2604583 [Mycena olivaceomarginata]
MPSLNVRWAAFFAASTATLLVLVRVVGYESFKKGTKNRDKSSTHHGAGTAVRGLLEEAANATLLAPAVPGVVFFVVICPLAKTFMIVRLLLQFVKSNFAMGTMMLVQTVSKILVCRGAAPELTISIFNRIYKRGSRLELGDTRKLGGRHGCECSHGAVRAKLRAEYDDVHAQIRGLRSSSLIYMDEVSRRGNRQTSTRNGVYRQEMKGR